MTRTELNKLQREYNDIERRMQCLEQQLSILIPDTKAYRKTETEYEHLAWRIIEILCILSGQ